jgi:hypothetical protein
VGKNVKRSEGPRAPSPSPIIRGLIINNSTTHMYSQRSPKTPQKTLQAASQAQLSWYCNLNVLKNRTFRENPDGLFKFHSELQVTNLTILCPASHEPHILPVRKGRQNMHVILSVVNRRTHRTYGTKARIYQGRGPVQHSIREYFGDTEASNWYHYLDIPGLILFGVIKRIVTSCLLEEDLLCGSYASCPEFLAGLGLGRGRRGWYGIRRTLRSRYVNYFRGCPFSRTTRYLEQLLMTV